MFTGIIRDIGTVVRATPGDVTIASLLAAEAHLGDSIAINGVDLTVTAHDSATFSADVMPETRRRSTLGRLTHGQTVNLEPAVRPIDGLSGHIVRGVVQGVATLSNINRDEDAIVLQYECQDSDLLRHMAVKGPVALDGVSLTLTEVNDNSLSVSIVQYTAANTTLGASCVGNQVNVETDLLARYVELAVTRQPRP